jgi:hypothetical protein
MSLRQSDLQRLAKLLGLLGSSHDGEVLAAARKAHSLLIEKGATWYQALQVTEIVEPSAGRKPKAAPVHHQQAQALLEHQALLTPWEKQFLQGILDFSALTNEQREKLEEIRTKVEAAVTMA